MYRFVDYLLEGTIGVLEESFKDYAKKHPGSEELIKRFKELNARKAIEPPYHDISHWMNKETEELQSFVDGIKLEKTRKEIKKEVLNNVVAENDEYVVVKINSFEEMYAIGKGTTWCVSSGTKSNALSHYNGYTAYSQFHVAVKKILGKLQNIKSGGKEVSVYPRYDKIAIQSASTGDIIFWDTLDESSSKVYDGGLPKQVKLPTYDFSYVYPKTFKEVSGGVFDVTGDVVVNDTTSVQFYDNADKSLAIYFRKISGSFTVSGLEVEEMVGFPIEVVKTFKIGLHNINSLVGGPRIVGGDYDCSGCVNLESLEGFPLKIGGKFIIPQSYEGDPNDELPPHIAKKVVRR